MLYDDSEQLEVRHVISLAHYDVDIYGGGEKIPEGELWIKRNCIRLRKRVESQPDDALPDAKPFFLFSDNCSEKEDFYHAILQSQDQRADAPKPLKFDTPDLVRLVQQLHASEEYLHTRWINAIIGRLFLALYKTDQVEQFIWNKITKKISRVPKPALISKINLQKIELTVDGDMTVEADVSYKGNFRVEISAIARIELGSRFKAREVTLVLATTLKKLEGHILVRIKPPPSNRMWVTFETAPKMELSVEPIVSSRQITYGVILRAIESRLREVVSETLVLPNWDDLPFKDTELNPFRGGIWTNDAKKEHDPCLWILLLSRRLYWRKTLSCAHRPYPALNRSIATLPYLQLQRPQQGLRSSRKLCGQGLSRVHRLQWSTLTPPTSLLREVRNARAMMTLPPL
jgi:hypothetical protein